MKRIPYLDLCRILACILVVIIHSPIPLDPPKSSLYLSLYNYFSAPCIGLFFMVSGALLLPTKYSIDIFLKQRLTRILYPLIFWTLFYLIVNLFCKKQDINHLGSLLAQSVFDAKAQGVLWFLYALLGLYFFIPIISPWIATASKKAIEYYLLIWGISLILPYFNIKSYLVSEFSGYLGYMILGYYLHKFPLKIKTFYLLLLTILISCSIPMSLLNYSSNQHLKQ